MKTLLSGGHLTVSETTDSAGAEGEIIAVISSSGVCSEYPSEDASLLVEIPQVPVVPWSSSLRRLSMEDLEVAMSDPASGVKLVPRMELGPGVRLVELDGIWNPYDDPKVYPLLDR